ncbi:uncharacterized protein TRUGW13939_10090 [Talaromyces rugulosus]|uniref:Uncharacterized protein n=1 Tax=Talaromyces rugulosus TaxID=121627 RepID=A0A7H8R997_TALRU|nr:uncharacterized protein TRUGW13939_10090 [Talaromyces rugulosus]QKX62922.1 hypothetical protein TRUGW13939_10090 [Talaromyces rugulosus]
MAGIADFNNDLLDFESLINWPEDDVETTDASSLQSPAADALTASFSDMSQLGLGLAADLGFDPSTTDFPLFDNNYLSLDPTVNYVFAASPQDFRPAVDSLASGDSRVCSLKQKRRDAAIDLHLQRNNSPFFSSYATSTSYSPESLQESFTEQSLSASASFSHATPGSSSGRSEPLSDGPPSGSLEMVLDMNMNATTLLPKKQRKRTKAEIDDYTNVRRNGACIKHKKQHKKCNCLDKVASPAITKPRTKNAKPVRRAPVHEMSFQTVKQPSRVLQSSSPQSHLLSSLDDLGWFNSGESPALISDSQQTQLSPPEELLLQDTLALQERHFTCLGPHCNFRAQSAQELSNHYNVHPRLRHVTDSPGIQTGLHEQQYIQQPIGQPVIQAQPLQPSATNLPLDTRLAVSLSPSSTSPLSSSTSSQGLQVSSQVMASSSSRGVNGAFPRPSKVRQVPSDRLLGDYGRGVIHRQLAELPSGMSSFQRVGVVDGLRHDHGSVTSIIQPLEISASETDRVPDKDRRPQSVSLRANVRASRERSLSWQTPVHAGLMRSYLAAYQVTPADFGAALTMMAAIQTILATFSTAVRVMQSLSSFSQHLLSFTSSFAFGRGSNEESITQMV